MAPLPLPTAATATSLSAGKPQPPRARAATFQASSSLSMDNPSRRVSFSGLEEMNVDGLGNEEQSAWDAEIFGVGLPGVGGGGLMPPQKTPAAGGKGGTPGILHGLRSWARSTGTVLRSTAHVAALELVTAQSDAHARLFARAGSSTLHHPIRAPDGSSISPPHGSSSSPPPSNSISTSPGVLPSPPPPDSMQAFFSHSAPPAALPCASQARSS